MARSTAMVAMPAALLLTLHLVACVLDDDRSAGKQIPHDSKDWPIYNYDLAGSRHNRGEQVIGPSNATNLEEKWRFPAKGSNRRIGVIRATPTAVNGYVYFGTATTPTFYKLTPRGNQKWSYQNRNSDGKLVGGPIYGSALVTVDSVFFGDLEGFIYSLDRKSGKENWKVDMRIPSFRARHPTNRTFSSPILVDGKIVIGAGAGEQRIPARHPQYPCCSGRGFVMALEPSTGEVLWVYLVGPKPEKLDPPVKIRDSTGEHVFQFGPSTSSIWSVPSYDQSTKTLFFGTDTNNSPRKPTPEDPRLYTPQSDAIIAIDVRDGSEKWVTQITTGDVWVLGMSAYDPETSSYKDQSIGDTPKLYTMEVRGTPTKVVGVGSKNGGFYVLRASDGTVLHNTPVYNGTPTDPPSPKPDPRTLALPSPYGGLQTGCATNGKAVFTNGIDHVRLVANSKNPPTAGRVVSISLDTQTENWRHERPNVAWAGGPPPTPIYENVGDPVASGIAVANGVVYFTTTVSHKLVALKASNGEVLKEIDVGPVWSGPSVSRGRVYVGAGSNGISGESRADIPYFPHEPNGTLFSFGLPGADEISRIGDGNE